ncbi:MAG: hypothetical protein QOD49_1215 [Actinomycetota bacterium]|nr:hypothetical protein [Actinomycetota bacterium]
MSGRPAARPQFLRICWEIANEEGGRVVEATLCRDHRREIARKYPDARGSGQLGDSCDACAGRQPRRIAGGLDGHSIGRVPHP